VALLRVKVRVARATDYLEVLLFEEKVGPLARTSSVMQDEVVRRAAQSTDTRPFDLLVPEPSILAPSADLSSQPMNAAGFLVAGARAVARSDEEETGGQIAIGSAAVIARENRARHGAPHTVALRRAETWVALELVRHDEEGLSAALACHADLALAVDLGMGPAGDERVVGSAPDLPGAVAFP